MERSALCATLQSADFDVVSFEVHTQFFGNWLAHFSRGLRRFELVADNREGWLALWGYGPDGRGARLHEVRSHTFDQADELEVIERWIQSLVR